MAKILVTGAAGFIGSRLSLRLLNRGDEVVGMDNLNDYYDTTHKKRNLADLQSHPKFTFAPVDFCDAAAVQKVFDVHRFHALAHIGAMASVRYSVKNPAIYSAVNVHGSVNLFEAARAQGPVHLLLASTGSVYGSSTPVPFSESAAADRPLAAYPASKRAMEIFSHSYAHVFSMPVTVLRFFNVYGPHGRPDMMPWQWTTDILAGRELTLFDGGRLKRDWTYIDDILDGFLSALDTPRGYRIFNLGCGNPVENTEFVRTLEQILGKTARIRDVPAPPSEPKITYADITLARRQLGYEPRVQVREGLEKFIAWLRAEKIIQV